MDIVMPLHGQGFSGQRGKKEKQFSGHHQMKMTTKGFFIKN